MKPTTKRKKKSRTRKPSRVHDIITLDPNNARLHPDDNLAMIRRSLEEVGAGRSIVIDGDNVLRAGHGVYSQARALGLKVKVIDAEPDTLIAVKRNDLHGDAAIRYALYDNASSDKSHWDADVLRRIADTDRHMLDGILSDSELAALARAADHSILLGYETDATNEFSAADQIHPEGTVLISLPVPRELYETDEFRAALRTFVSRHKLTFKVKL